MKYPILLAIIVLATAALACTIFVGGPPYPDSLVPTPADVSQDLQAQIEQALADGAQTGTLSLDITEGQLTAYVASRLAADANPVISDPQVLLRDGFMIIYGKVQTGIFLATVKITTQLTVDQNGDPQIEITQADFGPVPAPSGLRAAISSFLHETFTGPIAPAAIGFRLESINIADGTMTVTGRIK